MDDTAISPRLWLLAALSVLSAGPPFSACSACPARSAFTGCCWSVAAAAAVAAAAGCLLALLSSSSLAVAGRIAGSGGGGGGGSAY